MNLTSVHADALREIVNIGVGRAAAELNEMLQCPVELSVPSVAALSPAEFSQSLASSDESVALVQLPFEGAFTGRALLAFPPASATKLVSLLMEEETDSVMLDNVRAGTLTEVGNILLNSVMGSLGNTLNSHIDYRVPSYFEDQASRVVETEFETGDCTILAARTCFSARDRAVEGFIHLVFAVHAFASLLKAIDASMVAA